MVIRAAQRAAQFEGNPSAPSFYQSKVGDPLEFRIRGPRIVMNASPR
jgi:hypothetical protein